MIKIDGIDELKRLCSNGSRIKCFIQLPDEPKVDYYIATLTFERVKYRRTLFNIFCPATGKTKTYKQTELWSDTNIGKALNLGTMYKY